MKKEKGKVYFADKLAELDEIYRQTIVKLEKLHRQKIKLITDYKKGLEEQEMKKLINDIKK